MDALFYLFKTQIILLILVVITFLVVTFVPSSFFKNKKWGWRIFIIEIFVLGVSTWLHIQPKEYEKTYLKQETNTVDMLKYLANSRNFSIGAAIPNDKELMEYANRYFNSITIENELKYGKLIKEDLKSYDFSQADLVVDFAMDNNLRIRGHVLVWGRAADFFKSPDLRSILKNVPKEKMLDTLQHLIKSHINTVLDRYRGKIKQWDCVNEPLNVFDGDFDNNIFYEYLGKDYIADAFRWAHEADPNVELFLNEQFEQYDSEKAIAFIALVKELLAENVPIHGVGIQSHAMFTIPELEPFRKFIQTIGELGLKVEITELDARLRLFNKHEDPYQAQGDFYEAFSTVCLENPACTGITVWGITDKNAWFDNMRIFNLHRPNEPLPFDAEMNPKQAYFGLLNALKKR